MNTVPVYRRGEVIIEILPDMRRCSVRNGGFPITAGPTVIGKLSW